MKEAVIIDDRQWDKKKIAIGIGLLVTVLVGAYFVKTYFLDTTTTIVKRDSSHVANLVEGAKTDKKTEESGSNENSIPLSSESIQQAVAEKLTDIKDQVNNLDVVDIAQSSPQYKKAIKDLQSLQNLPKDEAKKACLNICSNL